MRLTALSQRYGRAALAALVVGWLGFHALTLTTYPPAVCDEANYGSNADSFYTSRTFGQTMLVDDPYGRDTNSIHMGRLYAIGLGLLLVLGGLFLIKRW